MKRVLITGASGFIGRHLCRHLAANDYAVSALTRAPCAELRAWGNPAILVLPRATRAGLSQILAQGFDAVCHLAAYIPPNLNDSNAARECFESNVGLTIELLEAVLENRVKRIIYFSTGNAYLQENSSPAKESDPLFPSIAPFYLGSKVMAEIAVEYFRARYALPIFLLRVSSSYGMGMSPRTVLMRFLEQAARKSNLTVYGSGAYQSDLIYVGDVVEATRAALETGEPGIFNIGSGTATSILELAQMVHELFGAQSAIEMVPTNDHLHTGFRPLDIAKARATWNWHPRSVRDGLAVLFRELALP